MKFERPLIHGTLIRRRSRFVALVTLADGTEVVAHCPNSGSMKSCSDKGSAIALTHHDSITRKLQYTWELTKVGRGWALINTMRPNLVVAEAITAGLLPTLTGYPTLRREVAYGTNSRIDILLEGPRGRAWVEVKNVTMKDGDLARFPDSVTTRGLKHLDELGKVVKKGDRGVMVFLVNRADCTAFAPARAIDPDYTKGLTRALKNGVEVIVAMSKPSLKEVSVTGFLPLALDA